MGPGDSEPGTVTRPAKGRPLSRHPFAPREMRIPLSDIERQLYKRFRGRYRSVYRMRVRERELVLVAGLCVILGGKVIAHSGSHLPQPVFQTLMTLSVTLPMSALVWVISRREGRVRRRALRYAGVPSCRRCERPVGHQWPRCRFCGFSR